MKLGFPFIALAVLAVLAIVASLSSPSTSVAVAHAEYALPDEARPSTPATPISVQPIQWAASLDDAKEKAGNERKKVLAIFTMDNCSWCDKLDAELSKPAAVKALANYVPVKVNVSKHRQAGRSYNVTSCPAIRVIDPSIRGLFRAQVTASKNGFMTADELAAWLDKPKAEFKEVSLHKGCECVPSCKCSPCDCRETGGACVQAERRRPVVEFFQRLFSRRGGCCR